tara:strand:+ start:4515 stop:5174 length:660 start_codon:yes stop_codon:yes gene_type:complete
MKDLFFKLGYSFKDTELAQIALTHKSFSQENNERLEFLGDAILNLFISETLYNELKDIDEGKLTRVKASLVSRENLNSLAESLDLHKYVRIGKGEKLDGNSILGNALEAVVGAIFLDSDYFVTKEILTEMFKDDLVDIQDDSEFKDPKSSLQEFTQKKFKSLPIYHLKDNSNQEDSIVFEVLCSIQAANLNTLGKGKTIKSAELDAAKKMLDLFKEFNG